MKGLFRRIELDTVEKTDLKTITLLDITFDNGKKSAVCRGKNLNLTTMEFNLLFYLAEHNNKAVSREELLNKIWGFEMKAETRATDDTVKRLRRVEDAGSDLKIETVWGYGFRISSSK